MSFTRGIPSHMTDRTIEPESTGVSPQKQRMCCFFHYIQSNTEKWPIADPSFAHLVSNFPSCCSREGSVPLNEIKPHSTHSYWDPVVVMVPANGLTTKATSRQPGSRLLPMLNVFTTVCSREEVRCHCLHSSSISWASESVK